MNLKPSDLRIGNNDIEVWRTVESHPNYLISNMGRIKTKSRKVRYTHAVTGKEHFRTTKERHLKKYTSIHGYYFVQLYKQKKSTNLTIHRIVAKNFIENPNNHNVVNHKDGNKKNNRYDNLEWCTNKYNNEHASKLGLNAFGSRVATSKLNERCIIAILKLFENGWNDTDISILFEVSRASINLIRNKKNWVGVQNSLTGKELEIK